MTWRLAREPVPEEAEEFAPEVFIIKTASYPFPGYCLICVVYTISDASNQIIIEDMWCDPIQNYTKPAKAK